VFASGEFPLWARADPVLNRSKVAQMRLNNLSRISGILVVAGLLSACQVDGYGAKHLRPLDSAITETMIENKMRKGDPILMRIYKQEAELEVWKRDRTGRYAHLKTYPICKWSGVLGPKIKEGDRQAPEGFYEIKPAQLNPRSSYYLSFNLGYPNNFDKSLGRTGTHLMVHGSCSSAGCYAMDDPQIQEIYSLARESFRGGQRTFQVHAFPFRFTPENLAKHADNKNIDFWMMLKDGSDHFELAQVPPKIDVCDKRYVFNAELINDRKTFNPKRACPKYQIPQTLALALADRQKRDAAQTQIVLARISKEREKEAKIAARNAERKRRGVEIQAKNRAAFARILPGGNSADKAAVKGADKSVSDASDGPKDPRDSAATADKPKKKKSFLSRLNPFAKDDDGDSSPKL
jgi:murein L,D-transpeptidase YafK